MESHEVRGVMDSWDRVLSRGGRDGSQLWVVQK